MSTLRIPMLTFLAALAVVAVGCGEKQAPAPATAPETTVDLSEGTDIFRQPVASQQSIPQTGPLVTVNGVDILAENFLREVNGRMSMLQQRYPPEQLALMQSRIQEQTLEQMIARQLLLQEADRIKMVATDEDIDRARELLESQLPPGLKLEEILAQRGVSEEQFRRESGDDVRVQKLIQQVAEEKVAVSDEEVTAFYEENKARFQQPETATARHILIAVEGEEAKEAKKAEAEAVRARLEAGEDFATVAKEKTDDPGSRETGGLYTFPRGQMVPPFEEAAFTQEIGVVGPLVETQFGYHIIKVESREEGREVPLAEVQTNLVNYLRSQRAQPVIQEYLSNLRSNATIQFHHEL